MKSKDRLRRYRNSAISVLGVLVIAIIAAAIVVGLMLKRAKAATDKATAAQQLADDAKAAAEKSLSQALNAQMEAGMAQPGTEIANWYLQPRDMLKEATARLESINRKLE